MGMEHYKHVKDLGGTSGAFLAVDKTNPEKLVVIKQLESGMQGMSELQVSLRVQHPHIIQFLESFMYEGELFVVLKYERGGDLENFLAELDKQKRLPTDQTILRWTQQLLEAVQYCHEKQIMHRDIKPGNIFLSEDTQRVYLGDFGSAKAMVSSKDAFTSTFVGSPLWISPEVLQGQPYSYPTDMWSLGCVIYEMACLQKPFSSANFAKLVHQITGGEVQALPSRVSPTIRQLVDACLQLDPLKRLTARGALDMVNAALAALPPPAPERKADRQTRERPPLVAATGAASLTPSSARRGGDGGGGGTDKNADPSGKSPAGRSPAPSSSASSPPTAAAPKASVEATPKKNIVPHEGKGKEKETVQAGAAPTPASSSPTTAPRTGEGGSARTREPNPNPKTDHVTTPQSSPPQRPPSSGRRAASPSQVQVPTRIRIGAPAAVTALRQPAAHGRPPSSSGTTKHKAAAAEPSLHIAPVSRDPRSKRDSSGTAGTGATSAPVAAATGGNGREREGSSPLHPPPPDRLPRRAQQQQQQQQQQSELPSQLPTSSVAVPHRLAAAVNSSASPSPPHGSGNAPRRLVPLDVPTPKPKSQPESRLVENVARRGELRKPRSSPSSTRLSTPKRHRTADGVDDDRCSQTVNGSSMSSTTAAFQRCVSADLPDPRGTPLARQSQWMRAKNEDVSDIENYLHKFRDRDDAVLRQANQGQGLGDLPHPPPAVRPEGHLARPQREPPLDVVPQPAIEERQRRDQQPPVDAPEAGGVKKKAPRQKTKALVNGGSPSKLIQREEDMKFGAMNPTPLYEHRRKMKVAQAQAQAQAQAAAAAMAGVQNAPPNKQYHAQVDPQVAMRAKNHLRSHNPHQISHAKPTRVLSEAEQHRIEIERQKAQEQRDREREEMRVRIREARRAAQKANKNGADIKVEIVLPETKVR